MIVAAQLNRTRMESPNNGGEYQKQGTGSGKVLPFEQSR